MSLFHDRRVFLTSVASLAGVAATAAAPQPQQRDQSTAASGRFDLTWLDQMKGQHKQVYDFGGLALPDDLTALRFPRNFFDTFRDEFRLEPSSLSAAVGISRPAFPMNASDRLWAKYKLGERSGINDPLTKQPAVRNIFYNDSDIGVKTLQARGVVFWQCNVALGGIASQLAAAFQMPVAEVRADLIAGFNPGVRLVPSHVMALALTQERGFTYMKP